MIYGKHINRYYLKYALFFIIGIAALVLVDVFQLRIPEITGSLIDGIEFATLDLDQLLNYTKEMLMIMSIMLVGRFLWRVTIIGTSVRIESDLRDRFFKHSLLLSQEYYSVNKVGEVMALYTNDLQTIRMTFGFGMIMLIDVIVLGTLSFIKMWRMDWVLTLIAVIPLLLIALMGRVIGKFMTKKFEARQKAYARLTDFTQESFSGIGVIRAFVKEGRELFRFNKINKDNMDRNIEFVKASVLLQILITALVSSILVIILGYGGYLVYQSKTGVAGAIDFTAGDLMKYISFFGHLVWPMLAIAQLVNLRSQAKASLNRINKFLNHEVEIVDGPYELEEPLKGEIIYNNLFFKYPNTEKDVLKDINFKIKAGESIGVIGRTGSGKTTLVDLLLRIYNLNPGELYVDGVDIMDYKVKDIRDGIAYVPQDNFLFSEAISKNIAFSKNEVIMEDVIRAADLADVKENIEDFVEGYETELGERGVTVSGGQKQRISIARALIKEAPILILDDSVSAVDTKTEERIIANLKQTRKGKTTILIAHRVSTVKNMDKIALIEKGELIGFGTYDELIKDSPTFKKMVDLQKLEDEIGGSIDG